MRLRRVIEHVKAQNWTAVGLDFVIVVMGVFIGIQVSNWNDARRNNNLARNYLQRLDRDIELEIALWGKTRDYFGAARRYGREALAGYLKPVDGLNDQFLVALYQASQIWYVRPNRATFDELQTTGRIVNIKDESLRTALANHYVRVDALLYTFSQTSQYRRILRLNMDQRVQQAIRDQCGDKWVTDNINFYYVALPKTCDIKLPGDLARSEIARLRADADVERELRFHVSVLDAQLGVLGNTEEIARATLEKLQETHQ
ncbi:MAG: hypothetical protein ACE5FO_05145 [Parvularculaceae bacterium]